MRFWNQSRKLNRKIRVSDLNENCVISRGPKVPAYYIPNCNKGKRPYILLAAIEADKLKIGTELIIKRSSCNIDQNEVTNKFNSLTCTIQAIKFKFYAWYLVRKLRIKQNEGKNRENERPDPSVYNETELKEDNLPN